MRNYTSGGDYAGSHSGGGGGSAAREQARFESTVVNIKDSTGPTSSG
jgi:hypothetical protein